ncbi:MAG: ureidoglycolate lyase [Bacillota bacterium]
MKTIVAKPLSEKAFKKYGAFANLFDNAALAESSVIPAGFFADVITLEFGRDNPPAVSVCDAQKQPEMIVDFMEAHQYTCEGLLPLDGDVVIFVGAMSWEAPTSDALEAFIVPKGTFVKTNPLILHGKQYPIGADEVHVLCLLPQRTFYNDMIAIPLGKEDQVRIQLP